MRIETINLGGSQEDQDELQEVMELIAELSFPSTAALLSERHDDLQTACAITAAALIQLAVEAVEVVAEANGCPVDGDALFERMQAVLQSGLTEAAGMEHENN